MQVHCQSVSNQSWLPSATYGYLLCLSAFLTSLAVSVFDLQTKQFATLTAIAMPCGSVDHLD
jgi:hypothetical protein